MRNRSTFVCAVLFACLARSSVAVADTDGCATGHFDSTFALIQATVFERNGCTNTLCHGGTPPAGGLDLHSEVAYDNLIDVPAQTPPVPGWTRVLVGQSEASLLWVNLAAKTLPDQWQAPLRAM